MGKVTFTEKQNRLTVMYQFRMTPLFMQTRLTPELRDIPSANSTVTSFGNI